MQYDLQLIGYVNVFENVTRAKVKEVFYDQQETLVFIIEEGDAGKAIGKHGSNVKRLAALIKKRIKIIEYNTQLLPFVKNCLFPVIPKNITQEENTIIITTKDGHDKSLLYGREKSNFKNIQMIVNKFYPVTLKIQ
ncbi:MAG: NusA-like transcription termination signal-binding factor [Nanoarchaeota archaeon]|nr:NusA-like transcription termination signal-binding factor [Nanoarchaeota archaeon]